VSRIKLSSRIITYYYKELLGSIAFETLCDTINFVKKLFSRLRQIVCVCWKNNTFSFVGSEYYDLKNMRQLYKYVGQLNMKLNFGIHFWKKNVYYLKIFDKQNYYNIINCTKL